MNEPCNCEQALAYKEALIRIIKWNELDVETRVNIGSTGQIDYYREIAANVVDKWEE